MGEQGGRRRAGGRAAKREARQQAQAATRAFIERRIPCFDLLGDEALELIESNADTLLEEVGIDFLDDAEALGILKAGGAEVEGTRARFPKGFCRQLIQASAPKEFTQHARNKERSVILGGARTVIAPAYGPPFVSDLDQGRRYATIEDFRNFVRLAWLSPGLHHSGGTLCEPVDLPVNKRHLDMVYSHIKFSDKPFMGSITAPERAEDTVAMAKLVFGDDFVEQNAVCLALINANSPLTFDGSMLAAAKVYARHNQATVITPFVLAGAMSPVTTAATVTQILAEAMAGMAFIQLVKPGAPVIFGSFASALSMQSGAPTFGGPEPSIVLYVAAQLARRLGVPFRSGGGLCSSKLNDAQAAYESANTLQTAALAGVNFMLHAAGWLEGGLVMGYEKFMLDADQCAMLEVLLSGMDLSENGQAMEAMKRNGPGVHFLGSEHTQANFETAFYRSPLSDNNSFEQWQAEGGKDAAQRANAAWKQALADCEPPPLDPAVDEALLDFIARRKAAEPDKDY